VDIRAFFIINMHGTGNAGVEGVNGTKNFQRLVSVLNGSTNQRSFISRTLSFAVARRSIPGAWHYELVVFNLFIPDNDPVGQCTARGFCHTDPLSLGRPGFRIPLFSVGCPGVAILYIGQ
jgi:hypothetical protein